MKNVMCENSKSVWPGLTIHWLDINFVRKSPVASLWPYAGHCRI